MVYDMHMRRRRPDYLQACPTELPVDGVKSALTPALWPCGPVPFAVTRVELGCEMILVNFQHNAASDNNKHLIWIFLQITEENK